MKNKNPDHLEKNVASLLASTEPVITMPEAVSAAILARLVEPLTPAADPDQHGSDTVEPPLPEITCIATPVVEPRSTFRRGARRFRLGGRRTRWLAVAAAVALVVLGGLWYSGSLSAPGMADVAGSSEVIRTMKGQMHNLAIHNGDEAVYQSRFYWRDPGFMRTEVLQGDDKIEQIIVVQREPGLARQLSLFPEEERAELVTYRRRGLADLPLNLVGELWQKSAHIIDTAEYRLGEEERNGIPTITYEAPGEEFLPPGQAPLDPGRVKIWVRQDTGRPLAYQVKFQQKADTFNESTASQLEWDVALDDRLFDLEAPEGWQLKEIRYEVFEPAAAGLASNVTLRIGPESGQPLVRESDVVAVKKIDFSEELDRSGPATISLTLELLPEAAARLASHAAEFPQELLLADFNGEIRAVPRLEMPLITLDLSRLNRSLGECERRYLRIDNELDQAGKSDPIEARESLPAVRFEIRSTSDEPIAGWSKRTHRGMTFYLSPQVAIANPDVASAWPEPRGNAFEIGLAMTEQGAIKLARFSQERIGERAAILLDGEIFAAPLIQGVISERAAIHGNFSQEEARFLAAGITGQPDTTGAGAGRWHSGRSKQTMNDMRSIGLALANYAKDIGSYPSGGLGEIARRIEPNYIRETPLRDAWGNPYAVQSSPTSYSISSWGSDGQPGEPGQGETSNPADDIIFSNGDFVQWHSTEE